MELHIAHKSNITLNVEPKVTTITIDTAASAPSNALLKTALIHNLEVVSVLPGTPNPTTLYFIV